VEENARTPWAAHLANDWLDVEIQPGLDAVDELLWRTVRTERPLISGPSARLLTARGRRLRPLFALLSAQFGDADRPGITVAATACELIHVAKRCHDEVLDGDTLRRGLDSDRARWNNNIIILAGDMLYAMAAEFVARLDEHAIDVYTATTTRIVSGQLREVAGWSPDMTAEQHYARAVADQWASLCAASCVLGGEAAGTPADTVECLRRFAETYGVAARLSAELRELHDDSPADPEVGNPLREGVATLPVLLVRERARDEDMRLLELLDSDLRGDEARFAETRRLLRAHETVAYCEARLEGYVEESLRILAELPEVPATEALRGMAASLRVARLDPPDRHPAKPAELSPR
jgi:heptaprenyl diphosphate synthase